MLPLEHSALLPTFIKVPCVIKNFVLSVFEWRLKTGFTVFLFEGDTLKRLKSERDRGQSVTVLDMCSGKGGDFLKWKKGGVSKVVCTGNLTFFLPLYLFCSF